MIGETIKKTRLEKGLSASELARRSNISQPYLSQLETGKNNNPTTNVLKKIAKGLDMSYFDLMDKAGYIKTIEDYDTLLEEEMMLHTLPVTILLPQYQKRKDDNGVTATKEFTVDELRKSIFDLYDLLNLDIDLYYKDRILTKKDKQKVLTLLRTLLE